MVQSTEHLKQSLSTSISQWDLLKNPFYVAWNNGSLSHRALQAYAEEYGAFITCLPTGWKTLNDEETAEEEVEHAELWEQFADALETKVGKAQVPAVKDLIDTTKQLFADPIDAAGALYAFEVQQPATAKSKLDGLQTKYSLPKGVEPYFEAHLHNEHEAEKLLARMATYTSEEQNQASGACKTMAIALWDALEALYTTYSED